MANSICPVAGLAFLCLLPQADAAPLSDSEPINFAPVATGTVFDDNPFDGAGDAVDETLGVFAFLNQGSLETRGVVEFDLSSLVSGSQIESAVLELTVVGWEVAPGIDSVPVQLLGFRANGGIQPSDFALGSHIATFEGLLRPLPAPVALDVTEFLQQQSSLDAVGFVLRTDVNGAGINFGSLATESAPRLVVTGPAPVPDHGSTLLLLTLSLLGLGCCRRTLRGIIELERVVP